MKCVFWAKIQDLLPPESFRAPFTVAEGWGTYSQQSHPSDFRASIILKWGKLRLRHLAFAVADKRENVTVTVNARPVAAAHVFEEGRVKITLAADAVITAGEKIEVTVE